MWLLGGLQVKMVTFLFCLPLLLQIRIAALSFFFKEVISFFVVIRVLVASEQIIFYIQIFKVFAGFFVHGIKPKVYNYISLPVEY
jgi:hypothetical protein